MQRLVSTKRRTIYTVLFGGLSSAAAYSYFNADQEPQTLNATSFTPFQLLARETVSSTSSILTLRSRQSLAEIIGRFAHPVVWSLEVKQPQLQIARSYTPLPPLPSADRNDRELRFLVRREAKGEVSNYLHGLPIDADIGLRGPADDYVLPDDVDQVVFLAGGTGIAPALQVAHSLRHKARIAILWASRRREECSGGPRDHPDVSSWSQFLSIWGAPRAQKAESVALHPIVHHLQALQAVSSNDLEVEYYVDEEASYITPKRLSQLLRTKHASQETQPGSKIVIISGPEGFINHWAGPKIWTNGRQVQGPLGGQLGKMDLHGWQVVKM